MQLIDFMGKRHIAYAISIILMIIAIGSLATKKLNLGLDFTGGTQVEVQYTFAPKLEEVRNILEKSGYQHAAVQTFGNDTDILVRLQQAYNENVGQQIVTTLNQKQNPVTLKRAEYVGAQVGEQLRDQGGLGLLLALGSIMIYLAIRFQYKFAIGAVVSIAHDVLIVLGIFSLFGLEFDLTVMAAVLAVLGYSLNDTIVIYDRIRENIRKSRSTDMVRLCNDAINQTLARTVATSGTTLLVLCALYLMGGDMIHNFALALILGIFLGTFSSIYVAAALLILLKLKREDLIPQKKTELEDLLP